jgi:ATP-dependent Clp protease ATP-binding subunit ClpX
MTDNNDGRDAPTSTTTPTRPASVRSEGDTKTTLYCSFCGKSQHEVRKLIAGPTVFICDECVELCADIIREENRRQFDPRVGADIAALEHSLREEFQWNARAVSSMGLLVAHIRNLAAGVGGQEARAPRLLLSGPSGAGKSELAIRICERLGQAFVRVDAASFRSSIWRGPQDPFPQLLAACDHNVERASRAVVIIDNLERLRGNDRADMKAVQEDLAAILRGQVAFVAPSGGRRTAEQDMLEIPTESITFVLTTQLPYEFDVRADKGWRLAGEAAALGRPPHFPTR